jgi:hypothetical protein
MAALAHLGHWLFCVLLLRERGFGCVKGQDEVIHACQLLSRMTNLHLDLTSRNEEQKLVELCFHRRSWAGK